MERRLTSRDRRVRVLVVDDDSDLVESYRHVFEVAGYEVLTALSGEAALGVTRVERPDVVVTDVAMPHMDGFELINRIAKELGGDGPPVVVCSAFDVTEQEALARGAQLFLRKPASADTLIHSIEALRRGSEPDEEMLHSERAHVAHERRASARGSESRLNDVDRAQVARDALPWLEWLRVYFDCGSVGMFFLEGGAVRPVVALGPHMAKRAEPRLLHVTLAAGVETGTSLVVADMATHPVFRRAIGPRSDIASFVGVPLITSDNVRIGALCIADSHPGRFDADALVLLEHLGRRAVAALFERQLATPRVPLPTAPLLARKTFELLLATELKSARRSDESVEMTIGALAPGVSPGACAQTIWRTAPQPRLAIGGMGPGRVGLFVRGGAKQARERVAVCLKTARSQGLMEAAGIAAVTAPTILSKTAVMELAESALSAAESAPIGSRVERVVVRTDSGRYIA